MARAGVTQTEVLNARNTLIARGINPSIDAIRVELGNTGSKSTIQRHLQAIDELPDRPTTTLSDRLSAVVETLAKELKAEAHDALVKAEQAHKETVDKLNQDKQACMSELESAQGNLASTEVMLKQAQSDVAERDAQIAASSEQLAEQKILIAQLEQSIESQKDLISNLEAKHEQARESLNHYRESMQQNMEALREEHEERSLRLGAEKQRLEETLSIKLSEATTLSSDNARLSAQVSSLTSNLADAKRCTDSLQSESESLAKENAMLKQKLRGTEEKIDELLAAISSHKAQTQSLKDAHENEVSWLRQRVDELTSNYGDLLSLFNKAFAKTKDEDDGSTQKKSET